MNNADDSTLSQNPIDEASSHIPGRVPTQAVNRVHPAGNDLPINTSPHTVDRSHYSVTNDNNADQHSSLPIVSQGNNADQTEIDTERLPTQPSTTNNEEIVIMFCNKEFTLDVSNKESLCVINLSNRPLSHDETSFLKKGLKFCPTPGEPNMYDIHRDLRQFFRRMRLKAHFTNIDEVTPSQQRSIRDFIPSQTNQNGPNLSKYKPKSTWEPGLEFRDPVLETFFKCVQAEVAKFTPREPRVKNITKSEKEAIADLTNDPTIIAKKADKGSAIVIMNRNDYIEEAERQLSDTDFYIRQNSDMTKHHSDTIREFLTEMLENEEIDQKIFDSLNPTEPRTSRFYFLPKIHKKIVKGRPIISGNGCPTEMISAFVDDHLKEFVQKMPSYVKDTSDFIKKVESYQHDSDYYLVTMDVSSLYTNIPNDEGITAVRRTLLHDYKGQVSIESLIRLLGFVLRMNNFVFNEVHYLQTGGTAMGTRLAPSYANLFMSDLEKTLLKNAPHKPSLYLRYIDDIFMTFTGNEDNLKEFIEYMNSQHRTIKFTAEYSKERVPFLDTWVIKNEENKVYTELFTKPTDTHNYLLYTSCHPSHCKNGGPYGEFLRIRRNCTQPEDYETHSTKRVEDYAKRGYPRHLLTEAKTQAYNKNRSELLSPTNKKDQKQGLTRVPLVVTFNPANPDFSKILRKHWPLISLSKRCQAAFPEIPMIAYRRNKNLSDKLVRAKLPKQPATPTPQAGPSSHRPVDLTQNQQKLINSRCNSKQFYCSICPRKDMTLEYKSSYTGRSYTGVLIYKCGIRNVVYMITCRKCKKQYVGQTYRAYRDRITEHFGYIRRKKMDTATGKHFNLPGHTKFDMDHRVISVLRGACTRNNPKLLELEERLIERLRTMEPHGLNDKNSQRV